MDNIILVEPQAYGYGFYEYEDNIIFIERFSNERAIVSHAENVSEGGVLEKEYSEYNFYFSTYKVEVFDPASDDFKSSLTPLNLPILLSYYSKSQQRISINLL